jgi:hypothetical protein
MIHEKWHCFNGNLFCKILYEFSKINEAEFLIGT